MIRKLICGAGALGTSLFAATAAFAQDAASAASSAATAAASAATMAASSASTAAAALPTAVPASAPLVDLAKLSPALQTAFEATMTNKGDNAWMLVSTALVLMMSIPGLALFYGGLVRTKNMLSVLMQVFMIISICTITWACWGYSMAFTAGSGATAPFWGGFSKAFMHGVDATTVVATFSNNVYLPEYTYVCFQATFAIITAALIIGSLADRVKFWPLMLFMVLWSTFAYYPIAHMVWYWAGPDFYYASIGQPTTPNGDGGFMFNKGALDFAGGTVVHINAGIAGMIGCLFLGKRLGYGKETMAPHSLTMTMIGASLLWVGWFGFNAGSNLEATGGASLAFINTYFATAAAAVSWALCDQFVHGKPSMLGAASGAVAGLVAITPASGYVGPMGAIVLGLMVSPICFFFVTKVKNMFGYDDALDVFGVHCIGGIIGALMTGVLAAPWLGGQGAADYSKFPYVGGTDPHNPYNMAHQMVVQATGVSVTLLWSGIVSAVLYFAIDKIFGLRPSEDAEREGLDITEHGERAYNY
ncbi:MAG: ammonium transporter [Pseudomonadota bacterium]|nr:ammonium transporter [Pseudomonadota bacterium]